MTEAEARELLRQCDGAGGLEAWIARQPWRTVPGGWAVRLEPIPAGLRLRSWPPGGG
jgi:hypothetical protein